MVFAGVVKTMLACRLVFWRLISALRVQAVVLVAIMQHIPPREMQHVKVTCRRANRRTSQVILEAGSFCSRVSTRVTKETVAVGSSFAVTFGIVERRRIVATKAAASTAVGMTASDGPFPGSRTAACTGVNATAPLMMYRFRPRISTMEDAALRGRE